MPYPVSDEFKKRIKYDNKKTTKISILTPYGVSDKVLYATSGNLTEDNNNDIQGQCEVTLIDPLEELVPEDAESLLYPGVNEILVEQTCYFPTGLTETIPMGIFGYSDVDIHSSGENLTIKLQGFDRAKRISDSSFIKLWVVSSGTNVGAAIQSIIRTYRPDAQFKFVSTAFTVNERTYDRGSNPWKACKELAATAGMILYLDREGYFVLRPQPIATETADWYFLEGSEAVSLEVTKQLSVAEFNHVVEIGEGGDIAVPFSAEATDDWSIAHTGDRSTFHVSSLYTNVGQCQTAANAKLEQVRGTTESLGLQVLPNPAIIPYDIGLVHNEKTKVNSLYIMDRVATPLVVTQGQYLTARKRVFGV